MSKLLKIFAVAIFISLIGLASSLLIIAKKYGETQVIQAKKILNRHTIYVAQVHKKQVNTFLANALALTRDGWFVTFMSGNTYLGPQHLIIAYQGRLYQVVAMVRDRRSSIVFLHAEIQDMPIPVFASFDRDLLGEVVALSGHDRATHSTIEEVLPIEEALLSEKFPYGFFLHDDLDSIFHGAAVFDSTDRVLGLMYIQDEQQYVLPAKAFSSLMESVFRNRVVRRPMLGVQYTDNEKGAIIAKKPQDYSPAGLAGLKNNDIIVGVDEVNIGSNNNLSITLLDYQIGDSLIISYIRDSEELSTEVFLGVDE